jgi:hypothetical protein
MKKTIALSCVCLLLAAQTPVPRRIAFVSESEGKLRILDYRTGKIHLLDVGVEELS